MPPHPLPIDPEDELICLGHEEAVDDRDGALAPPIVPASLFAFPSSAALHDALAAEHAHTVYTRGRNPTVRALEGALARLERGEEASCVASGMAAVSMVLLGLLRGGDHVLFVNQVYGPTLELAGRLRRFGIAHDHLASAADADAVADAIESSTRLIWLESPGTMLFRQLDLAAIAERARARGITTVIDNSWATPLLQKPLTVGIDLVVHSATKYLAGHSDVVAGAVIGSRALLERLFYDAYLLLGGALSPFDAFLVARGLRTLPTRLRRHHDTARAVGRFLTSHRRVGRVGLPGLDRPLVAPLVGTSGLLSFTVEDGDAAACAVVDRLQRFRIGVSWGGVESLAITPRPAATSGPRPDGLPAGLVRLSIGLEDPDLLIADLDRALGTAGAP